jgi:hypothetical protein
MEKKKITPFEIAGVSCLVMLGIACVCAALALSYVRDIGDFLAAPLRALRGRASEMTLHQALASGSRAAFRLGRACDFTYTRGDMVSSNPEINQGDGYATELSRQEVIEAVQAALQADTYQVQGGNVTLASGTPVQTALPGGNLVSLRFDEQSYTDADAITRSLEATVEGNRLQGTYHLYQTTTAVEGGQGYESALTLQAGFTCPVEWNPESE